MATRNTSRSKPGRAPALPLDVRVMNAAAALVFAAAALTLLAAAVKWATRSPVFTVRAITLDATLQRANLATVRANALPRLSGNFFSIDLDASRRAFESVPWVRRAVVRRVWPDRLAVTLEEHQAAALWQGEDRRSDRLVNTHGEVFEANVGDVEDDVLPTLAGPDARSAQMLWMLRRVSASLAPLERDVAMLRLSSRGSWRAELDSGATLELGRGSDDDVAARVDRFARTVAQAAGRFGGGSAPRALLAADLRHPDGYALRLAGISTTAVAPAAGAR
jgi:cell division protein FtsQ